MSKSFGLRKNRGVIVMIDAEKEKVKTLHSVEDVATKITELWDAKTGQFRKEEIYGEDDLHSTESEKT